MADLKIEEFTNFVDGINRRFGQEHLKNKWYRSIRNLDQTKWGTLVSRRLSEFYNKGQDILGEVFGAAVMYPRSGPPQILVVAGDASNPSSIKGDLYKSDLGSGTFSKISTTPLDIGESKVVTMKQHGQIMYIATGKGPLMKYNGVSFVGQSGFQKPSLPPTVSVVPADPNDYYSLSSPPVDISGSWLKTFVPGYETEIYVVPANDTTKLLKYDKETDQWTTLPGAVPFSPVIGKSVLVGYNYAGNTYLGLIVLDPSSSNPGTPKIYRYQIGAGWLQVQDLFTAATWNGVPDLSTSPAVSDIFDGIFLPSSGELWLLASGRVATWDGNTFGWTGSEPYWGLLLLVNLANLRITKVIAATNNIGAVSGQLVARDDLNSGLFGMLYNQGNQYINCYFLDPLTSYHRQTISKVGSLNRNDPNQWPSGRDLILTDELIFIPGSNDPQYRLFLDGLGPDKSLVVSSLQFDGWSFSGDSQTGALKAPFIATGGSLSKSGGSPPDMSIYAVVQSNSKWTHFWTNLNSDESKTTYEYAYSIADVDTESETSDRARITTLGGQPVSITNLFDSSDPGFPPDAQFHRIYRTPDFQSTLIGVSDPSSVPGPELNMLPVNDPNQFDQYAHDVSLDGFIDKPVNDVDLGPERSGVVQGASPPPPGASLIEFVSGRMFLSGFPYSQVDDTTTNLIAFSTIEDVETFDQVAGREELGPDDGDPITAMVLIEENQLAIFKNNSAFTMIGDPETPDSFRHVSSTIGCIGARAAAWTPLGVVFLDRDGLFRLSSGFPTLISSAINNDLKSLTEAELRKAAITFFDNQMLISVPDFEKRTRSRSEIVVHYDIELKTWSTVTEENVKLWLPIEGANSDLYFLTDTDEDGYSYVMLWKPKSRKINLTSSLGLTMASSANSKTKVSIANSLSIGTAMTTLIRYGGIVRSQFSRSGIIETGKIVGSSSFFDKNFRRFWMTAVIPNGLNAIVHWELEEGKKSGFLGNAIGTGKEEKYLWQLPCEITGKDVKFIISFPGGEGFELKNFAVEYREYIHRRGVAVCV